MNDYTETLANPEIAGVYEIPEGGVEAVLAAAEANKYIVYRADLRQARNREQMLKILGEGLEMPAWYGANYDALMDCVCDMNWIPSPGYVIILENCHNINTLAAPEFNMMIDVFAAAANHWREEKVPFWCFVDQPANV